jgi:hypothetical protein
MLVTGRVDRVTVSKTSLKVDVPVTGAAVSQSDTDPAETRVTRQGNFGIGRVTGGLVLADFNATDTPAEFYPPINTTPNVTSVPSGFSLNGYMLIERYDIEGIMQTIKDAIGELKIAIGRSTGGVWGVGSKRPRLCIFPTQTALWNAGLPSLSQALVQRGRTLQLPPR